MKSKIIYDRFVITSDGRVFLLKKNNMLKEKKLTKTDKGYFVTAINRKSMKVHRLVAEAFIGKSKLQVDHIDGNKENNNLSNLEYVTNKENSIRKQNRIGNYQKDSVGVPVLYDGVFYNTLTDLSNDICVSVSNISYHLNGNKKIKGKVITRYE